MASRIIFLQHMRKDAHELLCYIHWDKTQLTRRCDLVNIHENGFEPFCHPLVRRTEQVRMSKILMPPNLVSSKSSRLFSLPLVVATALFDAA